ncbi:FHA domain-containing protein [Streptomyces sp. V3I7]|uniref:FHA domain-containing protein n=1 Tax=Streptomyces sp. V3I7 TaxID=3042278 RepID=UPI002789B0FE|nr:FHA domain-containing protein [Streptomyces sp. V3I7]MDQ0990961.1 hypothetical protein [Streptomyces sp. V3I7]
MPTCPNGHQSGSDDWCEVCGHRMAGAVPPPPPPPGGGYGFPPPAGGPAGRPGRPPMGFPNPDPELCPQCRTPREGGAPFCEECRWNFLTNTATSYTPPAPAAPRPPTSAQATQFPPPGQSYGGGDAFEYQGSRPSQINRPAEPIPPGPLGNEPSGPTPFGTDPSRSVPPQSGPPRSGPGAPAGGPGATSSGLPASFLQSGPPPAPAAPAFPQETERPPAGGASSGGGDDWVISPPSPTSPGGPGAGGQGGYGFPQPGASQAPPSPAFPQAPQAPQAPQTPQAPATWTATIGPDREYFMAMMQRSGPEAAGLNLPAYSPEQQRMLTGSQLTIGRRRHSTGDTPDIDLSVPPEDPGVSHQHAVLVQQPNGGWAVVDQNSTNGTTVNGGEDPIQPFVPVPLQDGDRVHVGAWTTITIRRG